MIFKYIPVPQNPTWKYGLLVIVTILITKLIDFIISKYKNKTNLDIAKIQQNYGSTEQSRKDLELAYSTIQVCELKIKDLEEEVTLLKDEKKADKEEINRLKRIIQSQIDMQNQIDVVMQLVCRQLIIRLEDDEQSIALVKEVTNYLDNLAPPDFNV